MIEASSTLGKKLNYSHQGVLHLFLLPEKLAQPWVLLEGPFEWGQLAMGLGSARGNNL